MAFIASQVALGPALQQIMGLALQEKNYMAQWATAMAGNITAVQAQSWASNLNTVLPMMATLAATPGIQAYAQEQFGNATYDIAGNYTTMVNALTAIQSWLNANIPANSITISNGSLVGQSFTPAQTAPLLALVNTAIATIA